MYHSTHACQQAQGGGWGRKHTVNNSNTVTKQQETARACQRPHKSTHNLVNGQQSSQRPTQRRQKGGPCEGTPQHATCGSSRCELHSQYELQFELHAASRHRTVPLQATCVPHCAKKGPQFATRSGWTGVPCNTHLGQPSAHSRSQPGSRCKSILNFDIRGQRLRRSTKGANSRRPDLTEPFGCALQHRVQPRGSVHSQPSPVQCSTQLGYSQQGQHLSGDVTDSLLVIASAALPLFL
jgi:hypothetical protein